ncbi:hypothetical protein K431DRAFT_348690 [Polychaeton citri CBS 116435]|uniref:Uncharacterized protein n=1 Tax=Polychaeton citri CBS 116435 TaxID=1314669 RepID=A0A9P4UMY6_9PEZI|nr:hypothetical protein K431DRAFT_348690 [Polychaeton citri CBS 116435]
MAVSMGSEHRIMVPRGGAQQQQQQQQQQQKTTTYTQDTKIERDEKYEPNMYDLPGQKTSSSGVEVDDNRSIIEKILSYSIFPSNATPCTPDDLKEIMILDGRRKNSRTEPSVGEY